MNKDSSLESIEDSVSQKVGPPLAITLTIKGVSFLRNTIALFRLPSLFHSEDHTIQFSSAEH